MDVSVKPYFFPCSPLFLPILRRKYDLVVWLHRLKDNDNKIPATMMPFMMKMIYIYVHYQNTYISCYYTVYINMYSLQRKKVLLHNIYQSVTFSFSFLCDWLTHRRNPPWILFLLTEIAIFTWFNTTHFTFFCTGGFLSAVLSSSFSSLWSSFSFPSMLFSLLSIFSFSLSNFFCVSMSMCDKAIIQWSVSAIYFLSSVMPCYY